MKHAFVILAAVACASACLAGQAPSAAQGTGVALKTTFVALGAQANAILVEPVTPNDRSHIALLITHPEHLNNFDYFTGTELPKYGYRAMMLNYYGKEESYYEFLQPIAAAITALRAMPGVQKVVLVGHSSGTAELSSYQDVAENGPAACQGIERVYKCDAKGLENLPKADGVMMVEANTGAIEKILSLNPAVGDHQPRQGDASLDMFDPRNGYDANQRSANYSADFTGRFFRAQGAKSNRVIDEALVRLKKLEQGDGEFANDEPFLVAGAAINAAGARIELADPRLMSRTHAAHPLLKADGSVNVQEVPRIQVQAGPQYRNVLDETSMDTTVRHYLSFRGLRTTADYRMTANDVPGVQWRSSANSMQGNLEGIRVPTLLLAGSCASALVLQEIGYDHSAAKDKEFVVVEGADHFYRPCKPEYGDTYKRAFDYMDGWLSKPGRFAPQTAGPPRGFNGTIVSVVGDTVTLQDKDGKTLVVPMTRGWTVSIVRKADASAIRAGSFIASQNVPIDASTGRSTEVRVLEPGYRPEEGTHAVSPANANMMTHGTVKSARKTADGFDIEVTYPGGGPYHLLVAPDVPVTVSDPQDRGILKPGFAVGGVTRAGPDGVQRASRLQPSSP